METPDEFMNDHEWDMQDPVYRKTFEKYQALIAEMKRRTEVDGIPRYITKDDEIMKMDWLLDEQDE